MNNLPSYSGRTFWENCIVHATEELTGRRWYQWRYVRAIRDYERRLKEGTAPPFYDFALNRLNITYTPHFQSDEEIPEDGALLVVSNHPTGFTDGIVLASLLNRYRDEVKILANGFLSEFRYMQPHLLSLPDPDFPQEDDAAKQMTALRTAFNYIKEGRCLGVFPAARLWAYQPDGTFADQPWKPEIAKFAQIKTKDGLGVKVLPIYVDLKNTPLFRFASKHGWLPMRRGLLIHEMVMQQHTNVNLYVGKPVQPEEFSSIEGKKELINFFRQKSDELRPPL